MADVLVAGEGSFKEIKEGKARVLFPDGNTVFYNPVQEFNRDLSVAVIKQFIAVLDEEREEKFQKRQNRLKSSILENKTENGDLRTGQDKIVDSSLKTATSESSATVNGAVCQQDSLPKRDSTVKILEALSATGLRSIRYALEIPGITKIIANDLSEAAVENIKRNIKHNNVENIIDASLCDAGYVDSYYMLCCRKK